MLLKQPTPSQGVISKGHPNWVAVLCTLGLGSAFTPALAQTLDVGSVATMDTVVVTASGFEQDIIDAPASISVIPREKLEQGAYKDLTDALRDVPGVIMTPSANRSEEHTSELQSLMRLSYAVFCLKKKTTKYR